MTTVACTIVSANYLAYAATLRDSLKASDPELPFKVLVVDEPSAAAQSFIERRSLDVVWLAELGIPDLRTLAFRYNILELNTNVKPAFLQHLLSAGHNRVIYCDPDTYFFSSLLNAIEPVRPCSILLTPHLLSDKGSLADELPLLQTGIFNLGFIAVANTLETARFLRWWSSRCCDAAHDDLASGQYVDQKWINFVPALFADFHVLRDPALNVAYWNIHERELMQRDGIVTVDGVPLVFFHFSGIARTKAELSRHKPLASTPSIEVAIALAGTYRRRLEENEHETLKAIKYAYGTFSDGVPILPIHRIALGHLRGGASVGDPFDATSSFASMLRRSVLWSDVSTHSRSSQEASVLANRQGKMRAIGTLLTLLARLAGPVRYWYLCKYLSLTISPLQQRREILRLLGQPAVD